MTHLRVLLAAVLWAAFSWPTLANGEGGQSMRLDCFPADMFARMAFTRYGELPVGRGVDNDGWLTELYASEDGSTWTLVVTPSPEKRCLMMAGQAWQSLSPDWKAKGDPL